MLSTMKYKVLLLILISLLYSKRIVGQSVSLTPNTMSPSTFTFGSPTGAGARPADFINTSQSLKYRGSNSFTTFVQVNFTNCTIPPGIKFYLVAASPGSTGKGIPDPEFEVGYSPHNIMTSIAIQAPNIQVPLTLRIVISDFSLLRAQTYPMTLTYTILQQWW